MEKEKSKHWFEDIETIVSNPLRFKAKLAIGEDAYTSLRLKNMASEAWDALVSAGAGSSVSFLLAPSGFLAFFGLGTPLGWVIAAGVLTGGAWFGVTRYLKGDKSNRTIVIPEFINTPMDVLALALFDLLAPLALKVSHIDGHVDESERNLINNYFVKGWGYDKKFVTEGIVFIEPRLSDFSIEVLAKTLAEFKKENPDCNYESMSKEILTFLQDIIESDGRTDHCEEWAIQKVKDIFEKTGSFSFEETAQCSWESIKSAASSVMPNNIFSDEADCDEAEQAIQKFNDAMLADYMEGFWGYGNLNGDYWYVGMEEGGGDSFEEVNQRISQWDKRGRHSFEDLYEYHMDINVPKWFQQKAPLQATWNRLIRVLLVTKGRVPDRETVRAYQIEQLGRSNGEVCLLELLPLPSPTTSHWMYGEHSDIPILSSRDVYTEKMGAIRAKKITELILENQPIFVMFYGIGYLDWWRKVVGIELTSKMLHNKTAYFGKLGNTAIAVSQHPVATGVSLDYFHEIGQELSV